MRDGAGSMSRYEKMTGQPVVRLIAALSVPTILSMLVSSIYNLVDTAFVGRLGTSQSAAIGVVFGFMALIQAVGFMFGMGSGSISARLLGARDPEAASRVASTGILCSVGTGVMISAAAAAFMDPIVRLLGSTPTIAPYAKQYLTYILLAAPAMTGSYTLNNLLRFEGKASLGMVGMMTGAVLNIALDPVLMFALDMGIAGAAAATAFSQVVSFSILLSMYLRGKTAVRISLKKVDLKPRMVGDIMTTGLPSLLRQVLNSLATILLNSSAGPYGDEAVAAMSIVSRVSFFVFALALGIGQGFQPVAAFNYGAKKYARLRKAFWVTVVMAETVLAVTALAGSLISDHLIALFRDDPQVIVIGTRALRLQFLTLLFLPFTMAAEMLYQSTGHRAGASLMSAARSGLFFIPALLILSRVRGLAGIQEAQPLAYVLAFPLSLYYVLRFLRRIPAEDRA
ncbi:MAG: MATE family efflux transporter [Clostridia bacterium]|nr:MATE family efflux transporter [Clostridia bacterium]